MIAPTAFASTAGITHRRAVMILLGCTLIWGASFTVNKMVLAAVSPLLLLGIRSTLAGLMMAPVYRGLSRADWRAGLALGTLFGVQLALFITGLARIPSNRAAFVFSICTPLVPLMVFAVTRRPPRRREIVSVILAVAGMWWLAGSGGLTPSFSLGDGLMLGSAVCAAAYVVAAGHWAPRHDPFRLLAAQFVVMAAVALALAAGLERFRFEGSLWIVLLVVFLALSSVATFGGQLVGQRLVRPTEAALIYALEPVVAAAAGYIALGETLHGGQWIGAALIVAATLVVGLGRPS